LNRFTDVALFPQPAIILFRLDADNQSQKRVLGQISKSAYLAG
jgi:hypothetical protein